MSVLRMSIEARASRGAIIFVTMDLGVGITG